MQGGQPTAPSPPSRYPATTGDLLRWSDKRHHAYQMATPITDEHWDIIAPSIGLLLIVLALWLVRRNRNGKFSHNNNYV